MGLIMYINGRKIVYKKLNCKQKEMVMTEIEWLEKIYGAVDAVGGFIFIIMVCQLIQCAGCGGGK